MVLRYAHLKRARTDYLRCALTPSGSPCGRSTSPDGEVVEPPTTWFEARIDRNSENFEV